MLRIQTVIMFLVVVGVTFGTVFALNALVDRSEQATETQGATAEEIDVGPVAPIVTKRRVLERRERRVACCRPNAIDPTALVVLAARHESGPADLFRVQPVGGLSGAVLAPG